MIPKENNFQQPGQRYRSWDPARQVRCGLQMWLLLCAACKLPVGGACSPMHHAQPTWTHMLHLLKPLFALCPLQDRFIQRVSDILLDPRCTQASSAHPPPLCRSCVAIVQATALHTLAVLRRSAVPAHLPCTKLLLLPLPLLLQIGCRCNLQLEPAQSEPAHPPPAHQPSLQEIRRVWLGMLSQCDQGLGQKLAAKLQAASAL